jgi:hypothetical protein
MKTLKKLFLLITVTGLLFSCSKDDFWHKDSPGNKYGHDKVNHVAPGLDQLCNDESH